MPHQVFISYATDDKDTADRVCDSLEAAGIPCWIAPRDIEPGASFPAAIVNAIEQSQVFVLVLSEHSNASAHVRSEVDRAFTKGIGIVPLRIDAVQLSPELRYFLSTVQWLDAQSGSMDLHLEQLAKAVSDVLAGGGGSLLPSSQGWRGWLRHRRVLLAALPALVLMAGLGINHLYRRGPEQQAQTRPKTAEGLPQPPDSAVTKTWVNPASGQTYVWIPPGKFLMGCSAADSDCKDDEKPAHWVNIAKGFWLGQTEVTWKAYRQHGQKLKLQVAEANDDLPVTEVTWAEAKAYCKEVGGRLPSEAEWEYAARGGRTEARYDVLPSIAWYRNNSSERPHEVAKKQPNAFGLYDMLGNVSEWVLDRYYNRYDERGGEAEPEQPLADNASGILRGGSWAHDERAARASNRFGVPPDLSDVFAGFRCASDHRDSQPGAHAGSERTHGAAAPMRSRDFSTA
ncbi:MAG TPA: SUMF1/EgtB/PvdO family nonheme iron enzyme [Candidatus Methylomirabilis sp.]|nr:SUMF1/EgtB/PvdO family nonheme iron enzyme [Candidatus Methylomirabilis sp.]